MEGEQTEKSPSDEGFTELEPTVNGSTEETEGTSSTTLWRDNYEHEGTSCISQQESQYYSMLSQAKGSLDEEDEGVAQNSSIEEGESVQSALETEKQGSLLNKPMSLQVIETKDVNSEGPEELLNSLDGKTLRRLSLQESTDIQGRSGLGRQNPDRPAGGNGVTEEERQKKNQESEMSSWLLKRIQAPIEDMLFSSEEKSKNPPMFLCFKVGKPMRKSFAIGMTSSPTPLLKGRETQPEYWFAVPQERVNDLYSFFVQWSPDVYGKEAREQGFVLVEKDELDMIDNFFSDPASCSWEIITIDEAKRRQSFSSCDRDSSVDALPMLMDASDLLQDTHIEKVVVCDMQQVSYLTGQASRSKTLYLKRNLIAVPRKVFITIKPLHIL
ncbi:hypothetical protein XENOCAPTIV_023448 [Xenoophorus captivus]|uniref:Uncharacterized protein n=1 Tax=Xenoophorus captivus TaxID=1517983 RepID=A0ABV0SGQ8_9TELE